MKFDLCRYSNWRFSESTDLISFTETSMKNTIVKEVMVEK